MHWQVHAGVGLTFLCSVGCISNRRCRLRQSGCTRWPSGLAGAPGRGAGPVILPYPGGSGQLWPPLHCALRNEGRELSWARSGPSHLDSRAEAAALAL